MGLIPWIGLHRFIRTSTTTALITPHFKMYGHSAALDHILTMECKLRTCHVIPTAAAHAVIIRKVINRVAIVIFLPSDRLVGLVVKASASGAEDLGFESRLGRDFSGSSHTSDVKINTLLATLPDAWHYRVSAGTGRPGVSIL